MKTGVLDWTLHCSFFSVVTAREKVSPHKAARMERRSERGERPKSGQAAPAAEAPVASAAESARQSTANEAEHEEMHVVATTTSYEPQQTQGVTVVGLPVHNNRHEGIDEALAYEWDNPRGGWVPHACSCIFVSCRLRFPWNTSAE